LSAWRSRAVGSSSSSQKARYHGRPPPSDRPLAGKRGLVVGIFNPDSIAAGCALAFHGAGASPAATYLHDKAQPYVRSVTDLLCVTLLTPCDVRLPGQLEVAFELVRREWGGLDFLLHSIAFAPKDDLQGRVTDCSSEGFATAMDVSVHSFIRMAKLAEPLMPNGGCLLTVTFYGSERVVEHYNLMGLVKAALESATRYLAAELAAKGIRVHAISPGPIRTRAASGIDRFDELIARAAAEAPEHQLAEIGDVGALAAFLVSDAARRITGTIIPVDGGQHLMA
jgi:enoyl-[acyl-carrier protein] reductase I